MRAQSSLPVSSVYGFGVWGAARSHDQKVKRLPTLRGGPAQRPHQIHLPTSWAPVQRESRTVRPISLAFLGVQQTVGRQSTRATPVDRPTISPFQPPPGRLHALLNASAACESTAAGSLKAASSNASAASESTTAGGLEAFSQSSAGTERFEMHKGSRGYCLQPVTGSKMRPLNSAGIRARSSPLLRLKNLRA